MLFTQQGGLSLQYPGCLHAAPGQPSILINHGICICEDTNPQAFSSKWEDTSLQIPYETCYDIVKLEEQTYLVLTDTEFCIVDSDGYRFSNPLIDTYYHTDIIPY